MGSEVGIEYLRVVIGIRRGFVKSYTHSHILFRINIFSFTCSCNADMVHVSKRIRESGILVMINFSEIS